MEAKFPVEVYLQRAILPKESLINVNYQDVRSIALDKVKHMMGIIFALSHLSTLK